MKTIFALAASAVLFAGAAQAQQILSTSGSGAYPISVRAANGTLLSCRQGTAADVVPSNLYCINEAAITGSNGGLGGTASPTAMGIAAAVAVAVGIAASSGT